MAADRPTPDDPPPSAEELRAAEALRDALADPSKASADAELARALSLAHAPRPLDDAEHRRIIGEAVARGLARRAGGRRVVVRVAFGAAGALALAASIALVVGRGPSSSPTPLAVSRSTQPLFADPFPKLGAESERVDRIAMARGGDLRENQFARWGVSPASKRGSR